MGCHEFLKKRGATGSWPQYSENRTIRNGVLEPC
jgi:hypothetical protein